MDEDGGHANPGRKAPRARGIRPRVSSVPVIFILSGNYAGSHLLARLLGAHPRCADIGELRNLPKFSRRRGPNASGTAAAFAESPLFEGFLEDSPDHWHERLLARIRREDPGVNVLIDNSKRVDWVDRFVGGSNLDVRCVHLLRDPRALVRRWQQTFDRPARRRRIRLREVRRQWRNGLRILRAPEPEMLAWRWLRENREISAWLQRHRPLARRLSYLELLEDPEGTLRRLMPALGLDYHVDQLEYERSPQYGTRKADWSAVAESGPLRPDLRWQRELDAAARDAVTSLPELREHLAELGYGFAERGLEPMDTNQTTEQRR
jgi:hypothetical protein